MSLSLLFWILFLLWTLASWLRMRCKAQSWVPGALLVLLMLVLGWAVFGAPVHT